MATVENLISEIKKYLYQNELSYLYKYKVLPYECLNKSCKYLLMEVSCPYKDIFTIDSNGLSYLLDSLSSLGTTVGYLIHLNDERLITYFILSHSEFLDLSREIFI